MEETISSATAQSIAARSTQAVADLGTKGYAVIPGCLTPEDAQRIYSELWDTIEGITASTLQPLRRTQTAVDIDANGLPGMRGIVMEPSELSHAKPVWDARKASGPYFAALWCTGDLISSFDRVNVMPAVPLDCPPKRVPKVGQWMHTDQTSLREGLMCVQGFVDLLGTGPLDGGLVVAEGSHLHHRRLLYDSWGVYEPDDWYKLTDAQRAHVDANFSIVKVECPPGSLVLWDSRTFHQNTPPQPGGHARAVVYTCMLPRHTLAPPHNLAEYARNDTKKRNAFTTMRATSHWPHRTKLFGKHMQTYGRPVRFFNIRADVIQQPDVARDPIVAALACFSDKPAFSYPLMTYDQKHLPHASFALLGMNVTALHKLPNNRDAAAANAVAKEHARGMKRAREDEKQTSH